MTCRFRIPTTHARRRTYKDAAALPIQVRRPGWKSQEASGSVTPVIIRQLQRPQNRKDDGELAPSRRDSSDDAVSRPMTRSEHDP